MSGRSIWSFRHLKHLNLSTGDDFIHSSRIIFLVPFLATREAVAVSGRFIRSFRHLKHQNISTGYDFIQSSGIIFLVPFLATKEALAPLVNDPIMQRRLIRSFRHLECQNPSIISESIGIPNGSEKMGKKVRNTERNGGTESYSYRREYL